MTPSKQVCVGFIDTTRVIHTDDANFSTSGITEWTATEDCWAFVTLQAKNIYQAEFKIDGVNAFVVADNSKNGTNTIWGAVMIPIKKGQKISSRLNVNTVSCQVTVYGMIK